MLVIKFLVMKGKILWVGKDWIESICECWVKWGERRMVCRCYYVNVMEDDVNSLEKCCIYDFNDLWIVLFSKKGKGCY